MSDSDQSLSDTYSYSEYSNETESSDDQPKLYACEQCNKLIDQKCKHSQDVPCTWTEDQVWVCDECDKECSDETHQHKVYGTKQFEVIIDPDQMYWCPKEKKYILGKDNCMHLDFGKYPRFIKEGQANYCSKCKKIVTSMDSCIHGAFGKKDTECENYILQLEQANKKIAELEKKIEEMKTKSSERQAIEITVIPEEKKESKKDKKEHKSETKEHKSEHKKDKSETKEHKNESEREHKKHRHEEKKKEEIKIEEPIIPIVTEIPLIQPPKEEPTEIKIETNDDETKLFILNNLQQIQMMLTETIQRIQ